MLKTDIIKRVEQNEAERITERINRSYCLFNYGEIRISHWVAVFALSDNCQVLRKKPKKEIKLLMDSIFIAKILYLEMMHRT